MFKFKVFYIGLTNAENPIYPDSYTFSIGFDYCFIAGKEHAIDWPNGAIKPKANGKDDVVLCGLVLSPQNDLAIFFTGFDLTTFIFIFLHFFK
jgi:hypothetical protein